MSESRSINSIGRAPFPETRWSIVIEMQRDGAPNHARLEEATETLCEIYWGPVYGYIRDLGMSVEDAQDVTQEVFSSLISARRFAELDRSRGHLRSFLKAVAKRQVAEFLRFRGRLKRGGDIAFVSLDAGAPEAAAEGYSHESLSEPELAFDRKWATDLLARTARRLRQFHEKKGKVVWFEKLFPQLVPGGDGTPYEILAQQLGTSLSSVKVGVYRLRKQYGDFLREEVARTIESDSDVEIERELAFLREALTVSTR